MNESVEVHVKKNNKIEFHALDHNEILYCELLIIGFGAVTADNLSLYSSSSRIFLFGILFRGYRLSAGGSCSPETKKRIGV
ncbi:hypothetical protein LEP1GSC058_1899 [Leptospira fainei serovar Hurstbridge str. BUT 6]|uniref:Uncharacterized protein n=1 Tax=Leptospira fainei serovar Hurstbridge str. BUT 6 TaxID=1193011 RepID=S3V4P5_9LEPT|nr:hypothetical protein [Leptospira fainei]EPG75559.1 hypothetical protein LEP1GSC058_1899 [Leptospira fainei serovar Hurstbridge str. BUT 6]